MRELDNPGDKNLLEEAPPEVAWLLAEMKTVATVPIAPVTAERQVLSLAVEADRLASGVGERAVSHRAPVAERSMWRSFLDKNMPRLARAVAAVVAASSSMIGLAYAGVDLPGQAAARALEAVSGLDLPNQDDDSGASVAEDVKAVVDSDAEKGCAFGQAVAAAAGQNRKGTGGSDTDPCAGSSGEDAGEPEGSHATGEAASAEGRAKAAEASEGASDAGAGNSAEGRATAGENSGGASDAGAGNAGDNAPDVPGGQGDAQGGRETGHEASVEGRANAPMEVPPAH